MPATVDDVVFSEPSGRSAASIQFAGALVFSGLYVYSRIAGGADSSGRVLGMAVGAALAGTAESLPKDRRLTAGALRLTAILVLLSLLAAVRFSPEFIVG